MFPRSHSNDQSKMGVKINSHPHMYSNPFNQTKRALIEIRQIRIKGHKHIATISWFNDLISGFKSSVTTCNDNKVQEVCIHFSLFYFSPSPTSFLGSSYFKASTKGFWNQLSLITFFLSQLTCSLVLFMNITKFPNFLALISFVFHFTDLMLLYE